jgi:hypothetical protein
MERRGQMSVFFIVAIVIVAIVIAFVLIRNGTISNVFRQNAESRAGFSGEVEDINGRISNCLTNVSAEALDVAGAQGGYYHKPEHYLEINGTFYTYYAFQGLSKSPNLAIIEDELANYVDDNSNRCAVNNSEVYVKYDKSHTKVMINNNFTYFSVDFPITIEKGNQTSRIDKFDLRIASKIKDMINVSGWMSDEYNKNSTFFCVSCLEELAREKDLYVEMIRYNNDTTVIMLQTNITSSPRLFIFLNKYGKK